MYHWDMKIRYVRGLGPQRSRELTKIGIHTVGDLLEYPPLSYIYPGVTPIADAKEGMVVIKAIIGGIRWKGYHKSACMVADLKDDTGTCVGEWYGGYASCHLHSGLTMTFYGKMKGGVLQQPRWTAVESTMENVYGGQYGVHHDTIRAALKEVLANVELPDMVGGFARDYCFQGFHFPSCPDVQKQAEQRLKEDEALTLQLALQERRRWREGVWSELIQYNHGFGARIKSYFPYDFTGDQSRAVNSILSDLRRTQPMQRLIHGEVGSGKTAVAFYAAMLAALNGKRTLILAPTTILASQHWDTLWNMGWTDVAHYNTGEEKQSAEWYTANIIIGTHAMLNNESLLKSASLVIIDEFQKWGVEQRAQATKYHPHLLLMSATPIPRTLASTVFGDLDVSTIRELPIERGTIITRWVLPEKREAMYSIIEKELAKGHQAYFVYPRISGCVERVVSADNGYMDLREWFSDKYRISLLTGRTDTDCKIGVLRDFKAGATNILVSTIIAEVGLDNPNATVMVVEGADRFGLSQLHQLRGRVCRSVDTAYCFLVSDTANEKSIARLDVIEKCNCGFEIAEHDLRLRGAGEVFSTKQTGLPNLKFVSLLDDFDLLQEAKELVQSGSVGEGPRAMMQIKYEGLLHFGEIV